jgi:hypothetical protein
MKKNSLRLFSFAICSLFVVFVSGILLSFLIMPAAAIADTNFWDKNMDAIRNANAERDRILLPAPPYITDNPVNRGSYSGSCPIGKDGAPQLRQTGLSSGAECRGACGMDCPANRCEPILAVKVVVPGGVCTYYNVVDCVSHKGCRDHDACYDYCTEKAGDDSVVFGHCHGLCNGRCYDEYGYITCSKWAALPGSFVTAFGWVQDSVTPPLADKSLVFSDEPVFTPDSLIVTPTGTRTAPVITNTGYTWAILNSMKNTPGCSERVFYADSRCSEAWKGMCGQIPSQCVDTSHYKNGVKTEFTYRVVTQTMGSDSYTSPQFDGWAITYSYAGNIVTADRWKNGVVSDYCYGVGSRDNVPWDGVGGKDRSLDCYASGGNNYKRESIP